MLLEEIQDDSWLNFQTSMMFQKNFIVCQKILKSGEFNQILVKLAKLQDESAVAK